MQQHWHENPYKNEEDDQEQRALSQESKAVIREMLTRPKKKSVQEMVEELAQKRGKSRAYGTVYRFLKEEKMSAFHIISKPKISENS